uniref:Tyrosine-protein phosphatase domain-containing protein n=1 Tax=Panagrolaimus sp. ES5 TaxID=591445 RepID=A0AC34G6S3_9BILA
MIVDETRVKLPTNIYINANHVSSGPNGINFIAAEGPSGATANEFWTMTFSQNIETIIMLCQCIESDDIKCFQYFPVSDRKTLESFDIKTIDYHEIIFRHDGKEAKIVERKFQVTNL